MFIFETENSIKLSSHSTVQINHSISFLIKKPITSWILDATCKEQTQVTSSLGEPLLTAIPKQLTKDCKL